MKTTIKFSLGFPWGALALIAMAFALTSTALAQYTSTTLYTFPLNNASGTAVPSGLIMDGAGNLYGTTSTGGSCGNQEFCGTVFEIARFGNVWIPGTIYSSPIGNLGSPLTMDAAGNLYGVVSTGGNRSAKYCDSGCGLVFELSPGTGGWTYTELFAFHGVDGGNPGGALTLDSAGNLYGTTSQGGTFNWGTAYKLTPTTGGWQYKVIHFFANGTDGKRPNSALTMDADGNLYGVADGGLNNDGVVFKLTPSGAAYHFQYIHTFTGGAKGSNPTGPLLLDAAGDLFGTTVGGGSPKTVCIISGGCGIAYELQKTSTGYIQKTLHNFIANIDGQAPQGGLVTDSSGNLYGATAYGIDGNVKIYGTVFELTPTTSGWTESILLTGTRTFGTFTGGVILDPAGNLYGPAQTEVIFQLSPPTP